MRENSLLGWAGNCGQSRELLRQFATNGAAGPPRFLEIPC